jgi:hypothetical protein
MDHLKFAIECDAVVADEIAYSLSHGAGGGQLTPRKKESRRCR